MKAEVTKTAGIGSQWGEIEKQYFMALEFDKIKQQLESYAVTEEAKEKIRELEPIRKEAWLRSALEETNGARTIVDYAGNPQIPNVTEMKKLAAIAEKEGILFPEQLERVQVFAASCRRLKNYLKKAEFTKESLAWTGEALDVLEEVYQEINRCIRGEDVDTNASAELCRIRRAIDQTEQQIRTKLDEILKSKKAWLTDSFISMKNGRYTLPVKKEFKNQLSGSVIAVSGTGGTCFIEPSAVAKLVETLNEQTEAEVQEKNRILYTLTALVYQYHEELEQNMELVEQLDFAFAKGKFSAEMDAVPPEINTDRYIQITKGRHPLLSQESCVPLDFELGKKLRGIIITGPNTGGKTVTLKLVGLFALMAQCGLHLPCESAKICMNSNVLCDIGDGQNISENLSTFSAHITNIIRILEQTGRESLVLLDELGSGTDPAEGMGLAIAILEELRNRQCLFVATTHYVEVKKYAQEAEALINARMTFDKETLRPMYQLVIGEAGESCAFYIAKRLGLPEYLLDLAAEQTAGREKRVENSQEQMQSVCNREKKKPVSSQEKKVPVFEPRIEKIRKEKKQPEHALKFQMGDSVLISPEQVIGIVYQPADETGNLIVQVKGKKRKVNHTHLKLKASASELYPPDYDFSIIFDTVEQRKARHQMKRKYCDNLELRYDEEPK